MRPKTQITVMVASAVMGFGFALHWIAVDFPIYNGTLFADYGDPDRPGHLKGVTVNATELIAKGILALTLIVIALRMGLRLQKAGSFRDGIDSKGADPPSGID